MDFSWRVIATKSSTLNKNKNSRKNWSTWMWPWMTLCSCQQYKPAIHYAEKDYGVPCLYQFTSELPEPMLEVSKLQLLLGFDCRCSRHQDIWRAPRKTRFSPDFSVSQPSPVAQKNILPSFPNFPFHWKCQYLTRSESSTERKSNFWNLFWNEGVN